MAQGGGGENPMAAVETRAWSMLTPASGARGTLSGMSRTADGAMVTAMAMAAVVTAATMAAATDPAERV